MTEHDLGADYRQLLTVVGRRSGEARTVLVDVIDAAGSRWLIAPYGVVSWVLNHRDAGELTLCR